MKIAICDDEPQMVVQIEKLVKQNMPDAFILKYEDGSVLLDHLKEESPELVMPMHCTGVNALALFREKFGEKCELACCGMSYTFG